MERARITPITAHVAIIIGINPQITGSATNILINLPLKPVAITTNLTEVARTTIDPENILPVVTIGLGLAPTNQVWALLMSSSTMNTNVMATRNDPTGLDTVQITGKALNIPTPVHNTATVINTGAHSDANSIAILDRLAASIAFNNRTMNLTGTADSLGVMTEISDLFVTIHGLIRRIHVGRVGQPGSVTTIRVGLKNLPGVGQNRSYSKAITSILIQITLHRPIRIKPEVMDMLPIKQRNAMSHAYLMAAY